MPGSRVVRPVALVQRTVTPKPSSVFESGFVRPTSKPESQDVHMSDVSPKKKEALPPPSGNVISSHQTMMMAAGTPPHQPQNYTGASGSSGPAAGAQTFVDNDSKAKEADYQNKKLQQHLASQRIKYNQ